MAGRGRRRRWRASEFERGARHLRACSFRKHVARKITDFLLSPSDMFLVMYHYNYEMTPEKKEE